MAHLKHLFELSNLFSELPIIVPSIHFKYDSVHIPYLIELNHIIQGEFQALEKTHKHFLHKKINASFLVKGLYFGGWGKNLSESMAHEVNWKPTEKTSVKVG